MFRMNRALVIFTLGLFAACVTSTVALLALAYSGFSAVDTPAYMLGCWAHLGPFVFVSILPGMVDDSFLLDGKLIGNDHDCSFLLSPRPLLRDLAVRYGPIPSRDLLQGSRQTDWSRYCSAVTQRFCQLVLRVSVTARSLRITPCCVMILIGSIVLPSCLLRTPPG